jgi:hypothetical protein
MLTIHKNKGTALVAMLILALNSTAMADGPLTTLTMSLVPPAQGQALTRYLARGANGDPYSEPNAVLLEIDASLPGLSERGHLRAIRETPKT